MFKNKTILITGGTGSFGKKFLEHIINNYREINLANEIDKRSNNEGLATQLGHADQDNTVSGDVMVEGKVMQINSMTITPDGLIIQKVDSKLQAGSANTSGVGPLPQSQSDLHDDERTLHNNTATQAQSNKRVQALRRLADGSIRSLNSATEDKMTKYKQSQIDTRQSEVNDSA